MRNPHLWTSKVASVVVLSALLLPVAHAGFARSPLPRRRPAVATAPPTDDELATTREQLLALLRTTPTLTQVLETDPSILADQDYVGRTNPQLAQYLTQHTGVSRATPTSISSPIFPGSTAAAWSSLHRRINGNEPRNQDTEMRWQLLQNGVLATIFFAGICAFALAHSHPAGKPPLDSGLPPAERDSLEAHRPLRQQSGAPPLHGNRARQALSRSRAHPRRVRTRSAPARRPHPHPGPATDRHCALVSWPRPVSRFIRSSSSASSR